jgi:rRNA-processing protein FCF1
MKVVMDTNFLVYLVKYNIFQQMEQPGIELIVPSAVIRELERLSEKEKKARDRDAAKFALYIIYKTSIRIAKTEKSGDEAVLEVAIKENAGLATLDDELARKARARRIKVIELRQKKYVPLR